MRRLSVALLHVGVVVIVFGLGRYHAQFIGHYYFHSSQRLPWIVLYAGLLDLCAYGLGFPDSALGRSGWGAALGAAVLAGTLISVVQFVAGSLLLPRFDILGSTIVAVPWLVGCKKISEHGRTRERQRDRVVLVATEKERCALIADLEREPERPAVLAASLDPAAAVSSSRSKPLLQEVMAHSGTVVVLDRAAMAERSIVSQAATLHEAGVRVRPLSAFYEEWLGKVSLPELERMSLMFDVVDLHRIRYGRIKRMIDVVVGVVGLAAMVVITPVILLGNTFANRGPLFYRQPRVGRGGRTFSMVKFRTMKPGKATQWTTLDDDRITRWGRLLRRTHVDELPQAINIVLGQQSLIGPRPEQPRYVARLRQVIPFYDLRALVRPGLTGWAQVKYTYGSTDADALEKLQYDFYYLRYQSPLLDVKIVARTLRAVLGRTGR